MPISGFGLGWLLWAMLVNWRFQMPPGVGAIIAALIGVVGVFITVYVNIKIVNESNRKARDKERHRIQNNVVQRYLMTLQDNMDSLRLRLENLTMRGGRQVMGEEYFKMSTLYALANVLAFKRILLLDGIYHQIDELNTHLGESLKKSFNAIDKWLYKEGDEFYHYHRQTLGEVVMEREPGYWRTNTYLEFRQKYYDEESAIKSSLEPAIKFIEKFHKGDKKTLDLVKKLELTAGELKKQTKIHYYQD
ncbi:MAG: hypothetical protein ACYS67_17305 [Planctomycetota bacterium]|jgi:hypothetical protein